MCDATRAVGSQTVASPGTVARGERRGVEVLDRLEAESTEIGLARSPGSNPDIQVTLAF